MTMVDYQETGATATMKWKTLLIGTTPSIEVEIRAVTPQVFVNDGQNKNSPTAGERKSFRISMEFGEPQYWFATRG